MTSSQEVLFPKTHNIRPSDARLRYALHKAYGEKCFYTGESLGFDDMEIDHIIPKAKGGPDNIYNYVPTSKARNQRKSSHYNEDLSRGILFYIGTTYVHRVMKIFEEANGSISILKPKKKLQSKEAFAVLVELVRSYGKRIGEDYGVSLSNIQIEAVVKFGFRFHLAPVYRPRGRSKLLMCYSVIECYSGDKEYLDYAFFSNMFAENWDRLWIFQK